MIKKLQDDDIVKIGICNTYGSLLTTLCNFGVYQNSGREVAVASTKTFTGQVVVFHLIALWYMGYRGGQRMLNQRILSVGTLLNLDQAVE